RNRMKPEEKARTPNANPDTMRPMQMTCTETVSLGSYAVFFWTAVEGSILSVDLDIWNGGSDLDNGEAAGSQGAQVPDADEESVGAYLLVNWDDDDGDGEINAAGSGWTSLPKPDLDESTSITDEDNLAQLKPNLTPLLDVGTVELEVSGADAGKIKLWTTSTKGTEVALTSNKKTWDLSNSTQKSEFQNFMANSLWIEGIDEGSAERALTFTLRYKDSGGSEICNDVNNATIVLLKLGSALHREMAGWPENRGHAGLLTAFNGNCTASDLIDSSKYEVTEMQSSPNDCVHTTWQAFHSASSTYWWQYDCSQTFVNRLKVLLVAKYIFNDTGGETEYCLTDVLEPNAWDGDLTDVESLRCDGLPELCYEWSGLSVWGKIVSGSTHYSIISYTQEHNEFLWDWKKHLFPATQCGWETTYKGVNWDTQFSLSDVVRPLGAITW
ncbi:MAG: hypothetical protein KJ626_07365, partial [Verrucomicrobia bacterium]|nr:hypothetical protein [Verrucomicrobiota bacterium]